MQLRIRSERDRGLKEVGIEINGALVVAWWQTPVGVEIPVNEIDDFAVAFGLQFIVETETDDILAVYGIDGVVVGEFDWEQAQAGQFIIELRNFVGSDRVWSGDKHVID